jgi:hypothetical protein
MKRASEIHRSIFARQYRTFLCAAVAATFAVCLSPSASALTIYYPSAVSCASGGKYQAPESAPADPTPNNPAQFDADNNGLSGNWVVRCTWSGFPHYVTTAAMSIHLAVGFGFTINDQGGGPNGQQCGAGYGEVTTNFGGWFTTCKGGSDQTFSVPIGTDLSTVQIVGQTSTPNVTNGDDYADYLSISLMSIY